MLPHKARILVIAWYFAKLFVSFDKGVDCGYLILVWERTGMIQQLSICANGGCEHILGSKNGGRVMAVRRESQ